MRSSLRPLELDRPRPRAEWFGEPPLLFADDHTHVDPKTGIALYGPRSLRTTRHKQELHVGFIGTAEAVERTQQFYATCAEGVAGDGGHTPFPGCKRDRGFRCDLRTDSQLVELITRQESRHILEIKKSRPRFEAMLALLQSKMEILTQKDHPLRNYLKRNLRGAKVRRIPQKGATDGKET